jgi:hypothetical protein
MTSPYLDLPLFPLEDALKAGVKALRATTPRILPDYPYQAPPSETIANWRTDFANWHSKRAGPSLARSCSGCRGFTTAARSTWTGAPTSLLPPPSAGDHAPRSRLQVGDGSITGRARLIRRLLSPGPIT